jgi:hypothetical protein
MWEIQVQADRNRKHAQERKGLWRDLTFSSTISGDGLRWFFSLTVTCGKEVKGWDATTGYLQSKQRVPIYAYLPSHHGFAELSFEALGTLRLHRMTVLKEQCMQGIQELSKQMKRDRRDRPKTVLKLNKSVYGIPDAGQAFSRVVQCFVAWLSFPCRCPSTYLRDRDSRCFLRMSVLPF